MSTEDPLTSQEYTDIIVAMSRDQLVTVLCGISVYTPESFRDGVAFMMRSDARQAQWRADRETKVSA